MGTEYSDLFEALAAEFHPEQVKNRTQAGRSFSYVTARTVMNRLDKVLGPENWWDEYTAGPDAVVCRLTIRIKATLMDQPEWQTITKMDAGGRAQTPDAGDNEKAAYSDALKRAAAKFGVGRYLYGDGVADLGGSHQTAQEPVRTPSAPAGKPPVLFPAITPQEHARRTEEATRRSEEPKRPEPSRQDDGSMFRIPRAGGGMVYKWAKVMEERYKTTLTKGMESAGRERGVGSNFKEWTQNDVDAICLDAIAHLKTLDTYGGEFEAMEREDKNNQSPLMPIKNMIIETAKAIVKEKTLGSMVEMSTEDVEKAAKEEIIAAGRQFDQQFTTLAACKDEKILVQLLDHVKATHSYLANDDAEDIPF